MIPLAAFRPYESSRNAVRDGPLVLHHFQFDQHPNVCHARASLEALVRDATHRWNVVVQSEVAIREYPSLSYPEMYYTPIGTLVVSLMMVKNQRGRR
jgi:hypothetical protein